LFGTDADVLEFAFLSAIAAKREQVLIFQVLVDFLKVRL